jgi:class 3 adenylate cyclase/tRNA A-37 threonylcarbamoyl transferase component Bud32
MPLFMDIHRLTTAATPEDVANAHAADVATQATHGVFYRGYWFNRDANTVVCIAEGPSREACELVHREAHGLVPDEIIEVPPETVEAFLGPESVGPAGEELLSDGTPDSGLRVLLVTALDGLVAMGARHGDAAVLEVLKDHDRLLHETGENLGGRVVRHLGGGTMLSFASASGAVRCAIEIQRRWEEMARNREQAPSMRIGLAAGEPVSHHQRLFGVAVDQARAICDAAGPGEILASRAVRELCAGKELAFTDSTVVRVSGQGQPLDVAAVLGEGRGQAPRHPRASTNRPHHIDNGQGTRYAIEREIGHGGMATVYLARDLRHDRHVAIKILRPELAAALGTERFLQEIRVAARLTHPNIVSLYDSGEANGMLYYVMPHLEGETLRQVITRERQLPVYRAVAIAHSLASALDHAHRQGIVHRDIKPENILLHENQPMILDFGIALALTQASSNRRTAPGISLGTPIYMSPEQASGDQEVDARTDIYALGCVLFEMLTGEPPFTGRGVFDLVANILTEAPPALSACRPDVPLDIDRAVHRALSKAPADRFDSASQFASALAAG